MKKYMEEFYNVIIGDYDMMIVRLRMRMMMMMMMMMMRLRMALRMMI